MARNALRTCGLLAAVLVMAAHCPAADYFWTGSGTNNLWDNPDNWDQHIVPTTADVAYVQGLSAQLDSPLIQDGVAAVCKVLTCETGSPVIHMTGGTFELAGWGAWWGDAAGCTPTFHMSGGEINFTTAVAGPGILEIGWQEDGSTPQCRGIWNMTDGVMHVKGISMPGNNTCGAYGELNVHGGVIEVGTARGGLVLRTDEALVNVTRGTLKLAGDDQTALVAGYEAQGRLVAYDGLGVLHYEYDGFGWTTVTATIRDGDANGDDLVNRVDASILGAHWLQASDARWGDGDFNFDGAVNDVDAAILAANWYEGPAEVPEPATITLLLGLLGFVLCMRRR